MTRLTWAAVLLAAAAAAGAGCGGDDGSASSAGGTKASTSSSETTSASPSGPAERVSLVDFTIRPRTDQVAAGKTTFAVTNDGQAPHALEIEGNGKEVATDTLQPGQSARLTADLDPGTYRWYCPVGDHAEEGMTGTLTVK